MCTRGWCRLQVQVTGTLCSEVLPLLPFYPIAQLQRPPYMLLWAAGEE